MSEHFDELLRAIGADRKAKVEQPHEFWLRIAKTCGELADAVAKIGKPVQDKK